MSAAADSFQIGKVRVGSVLELRERRVHLERLGEELRALRVDETVAQAVSQGRENVSAAADTCQIRKGGRVAHRSSLSVVLTSSASAKCLAPPGPMLLSETLQTGRVQDVSAAADTFPN